MGKNLPFKFFEGLHVLSGVDLFDVTIGGEIANMVLFEMDGQSYLAAEDPSDGYRSSLKYIEKSRKKVKNRFKPVKVTGVVEFTEQHDLISFFRYKTRSKALVLQIGTANCDDYYPSFVGHFDPKALGRNPK